MERVKVRARPRTAFANDSVFHSLPTLVPVSTRRTDDDDRSSRITRLIGVYDADGTLRGEVAYWIGARLGRRHCSLCDVTHGIFTEKNQWRSCRSSLPVPFDTYHRDDQPDVVRQATSNHVPVVVAETPTGIVTLLSGPDIDDARGDPETLMTLIETKILEAGLAMSD